MAKDLQFTFKRPCLELAGEIGSLSELIGYMQEESASLTLMFGDDMELVVQSINVPIDAKQGSGTVATEGEPAKPGRKPRANKDAAAAVAPAPLPVPSEAPPVLAAPAAPPPPAPAAPNLTLPEDGGIPPFLDRAAAAPPPPPLPIAPSPPTAPAMSPPPVGVLGPKVVKALDVLKEGKSDGGQSLSDWLAQCGLTQKGAAYDDACRAVLMISDEKLKAVAEMLKV